MKCILVRSSLLMLLAVNVFAAGKEPEFKMVDGKISIQAEALTLKQFLQLLDNATGMTSKVNPQLANEKISVRLEGLDLNTAIRKSFQGQPWNWTVVSGKGINVIDRAQVVAAPSGGASSSPVQSFSSDVRNEPPPPIPPQPGAPQPGVPLVQSGPVPAPANSNNNNAGIQPAGALNLPPAQGGASSAPAPLFQTPGAALGAPLPNAQPGR
jgi:hypothetical protein